jgi:hypothetical protein
MIPNSFYRLSLVLCLLSSTYGALFSQNFDGGFNFTLPPFDSTTQKFLPTFPAKTIAEADRVTVVGEKFIVAGQQMRFWGVNLVGGACFPKKTDAAGIAGRLRKMGVNLVRFHDLENGYSEPDGSIFDWNVSTRRLKATTLDRMEYFIAELKKNNIYVNITLSTSRRYLPQDGVEGSDTIDMFGERGKAVNLFDPYLEFLQREFAQQFLTHTNPYTGLSLANDPVLALLELNNENTIYGEWKTENDALIQKDGRFGKLTYQHNRLLDNLFQTYLTQKYTTNAALNTAWQPESFDPKELIQNGGFESGSLTPNWVFEVIPNAVASTAIDNTNRNTGGFSARITATTVNDRDINIQLRQTGFPIVAGKTYELSFWAKSDIADKSLRAQVINNQGDFEWFRSIDVQLTQNWVKYTAIFTAALSTNNARVNIMPRSVGTFWFDDLSVRQVSRKGLQSSENLVDKNIKRLPWWDRRTYTDQRVADMAEFYINLQKKHFDELRQYLRTTLNVRAAITGTNGFVGPADVLSQTNMDYLDDHKYWDLVNFRANIFNKVHWGITNRSMLKTPDLLAISNALLGLGLTNKPYTISEYNYGAPNRYRVEAPVSLLPYAALHGVDGIMFFTYNAFDEILDWESDLMNSHLSIHRDHSIMSLFPSCALAFRNGYIKEDNNPIRLNFTPTEVYNSPFKDDFFRWDQYVPHDKKWGLLRGMKTDSYGTTSTPAPAFTNPNGNTFVTATNETKFDPAKGGVTTATPNFVSLTGFLPDMPNTTVGDLQLVQANQFGSLTWVSLLNKPLNASEKSLITFSSRQQNTNMVWSFYADDPTQFTLGNNWGTAPTLQQPAILRLRLTVKADMIKLYPLSNTGREGTARTLLPTATNSNTFDFTIDQNQDKTLWYGVEAVIKVGVKEDKLTAIVCNAVPNPVTEGSVNAQYSLPQSGHLVIQLYNLQGQLIKTIAKKDQMAGTYSENIALPDVANGQYFLCFNLIPKTGSGLNGCLGKIALVIAR